MSHWNTWVFARDRQLFYCINGSCRNRFLDLVLPWITELGGPVFTIFSCLFFYFFGKGQLSLAAFDSMLALVFSHLAVHVVKRVFIRPRPYLVLPGAYTMEVPLTDPSFPSGHTTAVFALAISYALYFPVLTPLFILLAAATGFSRIYLGLHYPSDVLMGVIFGSLAALLSYIF